MKERHGAPTAKALCAEPVHLHPGDCRQCTGSPCVQRDGPVADIAGPIGELGGAAADLLSWAGGAEAIRDLLQDGDGRATRRSRPARVPSRRAREPELCTSAGGTVTAVRRPGRSG